GESEPGAVVRAVETALVEGGGKTTGDREA
ncbi:lipoate--protein ligase family protein, partial [Halococcus sp. IIIV-5B]